MLVEMNLFQKILLNCLLVSIIPLLGLVYQVNYNEQEREKTVENRLTKTSHLVISEVDNWVDKNIRNASLIAGLNAAKHMQADKLIPLLKAAKKNLEWVSLLFVMDTNGDAIARSDGKPLKNYSDREYVKQVLAGEKIGQQVLIGKVKPVPLHCFSLPIAGSLNTRFKTVGLITQCSTLQSISNFISDLNIGITGRVILVDEKNRLIAKGGINKSTGNVLESFSAHPAISEFRNGQITIIKHEGTKKVMMINQLDIGWKLIIEQDYSEAFSSVIQSRFNTIIFFIATMIITVLASIFTSLKISSPIKNLTLIADACSRGKFPINIAESERKDEIGELARAVFRMSRSISMALSRLKEKC